METQYNPNFAQYKPWKRAAVERRLALAAERELIRAELRRRSSTGSARDRKPSLYPLLRNLAETLRYWDACPSTVRVAAESLSEHLAAQMGDQEREPVEVVTDEDGEEWPSCPGAA